ncbi:CHAT domain-containing protein [Nonomuraea bangladeshensis]|uniref:CHAT domain-containing protein n=1 Tax=Nonomuraea bangladeshensis TaxID=404385 RepID=UPI0031CF0C5A
MFIEQILALHEARTGIRIREDHITDSDDPPGVKRWRCWLRGEQAYRQKDLYASSSWLRAADSVDPSCDHLVWLAERATLAGKVMAGLHEPGAAARAFIQAYGHWRRLLRAMDDLDEQLNDLLEDAYLFMTVLVREPPDAPMNDEPPRVSSEVEPWMAWYAERVVPELAAVVHGLIGACAAAGEEARARELAGDLCMWLLARVEKDRPPILVTEIRNALANLDFDRDEFEASARRYQEALDDLLPWRGDEDADRWIVALHYNLANALAYAGEMERSLQIYDELDADSADLAVRVEFSRLLLRHQRGEPEDYAERLRELIRRAGEIVQSSPEPSGIQQVMGAISRFLLVVLAESGSTAKETVDEILQISFALRHEGMFASPERSGDEAEWLWRHPVHLLDARLIHRPDTVVLVWESGWRRAVLLAMRGGSEPLDERAAVDASAEAVEAAHELLRAVRAAGNSLITREATASQLDQGPVREAGLRLWNALPEPVRQKIRGARTLLFVPSVTEDFAELPIELAFDGEHYLGLAKVVARAPSVRHLIRMLAPNRTSGRLPAGSVVVRAEDPPDLELWDADTDAEQTGRALRILGLPPVPLMAPTHDELNRALESGIRVLHYIGHGVADASGEHIVLSREESFRAIMVGSARMPFAYFGACLVGRVRHGPRGALRGFITSLLDADSPGVIAATYAVPDHLCGEISRQFYRNAWSRPVGEALRRSREQLAAAGLHPVAWASFTLYGDAWATLPDRLPEPGPQGWPAYLIRYLATGESGYREEFERSLEDGAARRPDHAGLLGQVRDLLGDSSRIDHAELEARLLDVDCEAAVAIRLAGLSRTLTELSEAEQFDENRFGKVFGSALNLAEAVDDSYAALWFIDAYARRAALSRDLADRSAHRLERLGEDGRHFAYAASGARTAEELPRISNAVISMVDLHGKDLYDRVERGEPAAMAQFASSMAEAWGVEYNPDDVARFTLLRLTLDAPDPDDTLPFEPPASGYNWSEADLSPDAEDDLRRADVQGSAEAAADLGILLEHRGEFAAALAAYQRADERGLKEGSFNLGDFLLRAGRPHAAMAAFRRADERGHARGANNHGVMLAARMDFHAAEQAFARAVRRGFPDAAIHLAARLAGRDDGEQDLRRWEAEGGAEWSYTLGVWLEQRQDHAGAADAYARAAARGYPHVEVHFRLGLARELAEQDAEDAYALAVERDHPLAAHRMGILMARRGELEQAEHVLLHAYRLGVHDALNDLGLILMEHDRLDEAHACFAHLDEAGHPLAALRLGYLLGRVGDLEGAAAAFARADQRGADEAGALLGITLGYLGRDEEAISAFLRARVNGDFARAPAGAEYLQAAISAFARACEIWREGAEHGRALIYLGDALRLAGRAEESASALARAETVFIELGDEESLAVVRALREAS